MLALDCFTPSLVLGSEWVGRGDTTKCLVQGPMNVADGRLVDDVVREEQGLWFGFGFGFGWARRKAQMTGGCGQEGGACEGELWSCTF